MCLILFAIQPDAHYELVIATNRDEYYARPTRMAHFWADCPSLLAGKDLEMGGTWLGITRSGRFAAVTNFRETPLVPPPPESRGRLTLDFLNSDSDPLTYLLEIQKKGDLFRGFNLILGEPGRYFYFSNRNKEIVKLENGCYGLSNQLLDCDWPKVSQGREKLDLLIKKDFNKEELFALLSEKGDSRPFSASFIESAEYGTCASTVLIIEKEGRAVFEEKNFLANGVPSITQSYEFEIN